MPRTNTLLLIVALALAFAVPIVANPPKQVPAYQASYSIEADLLKQILAEMQGLRAEVRELRSAGVAGQGASLLSVVKAKCASCHAVDQAVAKGDGFVLMEADGKLAELSLAEKRRVLRKLDRKEMPPPPATLTTEERKLFDVLKPEVKP